MIPGLPIHIVQAVRRLTRRDSAFSRRFVLVLAVGMAFVAVLFSLVDQTFRSRIPGLKNVDRLARLYCTTSNGIFSMSFPLFANLTANLDAFEGLAARQWGEAVISRQRPGSPRAERIAWEAVTDDYFEVLGVTMHQGTGFPPQGGVSDSPPNGIILSHELWIRSFSGAPDIVGTSVDVDRRPFVVVGVAAEGFRGSTPGAQADAWLSLAQKGAMNPRFSTDLLNPRAALFFDAVAKLPPGGFEAAKSQLNAFNSNFSPGNWGLPSGSRMTLHQDIVLHPLARMEAKRSLGLLTGLVSMVLLLTVLNAGGLMATGAVSRREQFAVMQALGARKRDFALHVGFEALVGAIAASLLATALAWLASKWIGGLDLTGSGIPAQRLFALEGGVFALTVVVSSTAALLSSLTPAWLIMRLSSVSRMGAGSSARPGLRLRSILLAGQLALTVTLLGVALLAISSLFKLRDAELGYDPKGLVLASLNLGQPHYSEGESQALFRSLDARLSTGDLFRSYAFVRPSLLTQNYEPIQLSIAKRESPPLTAARVLVSPGYLKTMGVELLAGRPFREADADKQSTPKGTRALVVSKAFADRIAREGSPIGLQLEAKGQGVIYEVVGIVADHRLHSPRGLSLVVYEPKPQQPLFGRLNLVARTALPEVEALFRFQDAAETLDPGLAVFNAEPLTARLRRNLSEERVLARLSPSLALASMLLALLATWSLVSGLMEMKRREIGIRMALGADQRRVSALSLRQLLAPTVIGISGGLSGLFLAVSQLEFRFYEMTASDPLVIAGSIGLLLVGATLATYLALRRTFRLNVAEVLRAD